MQEGLQKVHKQRMRARNPGMLELEQTKKRKIMVALPTGECYNDNVNNSRTVAFYLILMFRLSCQRGFIHRFARMGDNTINEVQP